MLVEFKELLNRDDLPTLIIQYDTTFDLGNYYMSWATFRFTEFMDQPDNPMPTIGIIMFVKVFLMTINELLESASAFIH